MSAQITPPAKWSYAPSLRATPSRGLFISPCLFEDLKS